MIEQDLIKQLKTFKAIKLDANWKAEQKNRLFLMFQAVQTHQTPQVFQAISDFLFLPLSQRTFAISAVFLTIISLLFGNFLLGVNKEIDREILLGNISLSFKKIDKPDLTKNTESEKIISLSSAKQMVQHPKLKQVAVENKFSNSVPTSPNASLNVSSDEIILSFRASLMEEINRVWVLAYEAGNNDALKAAEEAEALFKQGDLDGALRAVMAAKALLIQ